MAEDDKTRATVQTFGDGSEDDGSYDSRRVPVYRPSAADPAEQRPDGTRIMESAPPDTSRPAPREGGSQVRAPTSAELAQKSQKQRRRERDRRAEKTAQRVILALGAALGLAGLGVVQSGILDDAPSPTPANPSEEPSPTAARPALTAAPDETPDLPLFNKIRAEGLTIVAEGLPEVVAIDPPNPPPLLAGIQTCRFAYAIWEFSPNRAFRFLSTCSVLDGQILVGAYEMQGSEMRLSPLSSDGTVTVSVFQVEKPSRMTSTVKIQPRADGPMVILEVRQRITVMRPGMEGNAFFRTYAPRNSTEIQGMPTRKGGPQDPGGARHVGAEKGAAKDGAGKENDPVLDLLKGGEN